MRKKIRFTCIIVFVTTLTMAHFCSAGQKVAESSITNTNGDCGILENWRPTNSNGGNSISYYDPIDKKWKQNWVANGSVSHYEEPEDYRDGEMQLIAKGVGW